MNNGQMDCGIENPTQHLPWWLRKPRKNLSQVGRHRDLNPGPPECESRALPRSHLARLNRFLRKSVQLKKNIYYGQGAKGDWDFRISDLVKNPDGTDI